MCSAVSDTPTAARLAPTAITRLFAIRRPILCGGLMWLSDARYVAASARAGALGFLTARSHADLPSFADELARAIDLADGAPVGVNVTFSRRAEANRLVGRQLDHALECGITRFETVGSGPIAEVFARIHAGGGRVIHKCSRLRHALAAERDGADAVTLVGAEAGGHPGPNQLPMHVQAALAARALGVPFAVAGAIGTGEQVAAALLLGASAVVVGSRFLAADEIWAHDNYKQRVEHTGADDTVATMATLGETWRVLSNATARDTIAREALGVASILDFGPSVRGSYGRDHAYRDGDAERGMLSMGPAVAFARRGQSVAAIVDELSATAAAALARAPALIGEPTA